MLPPGTTYIDHRSSSLGFTVSVESGAYLKLSTIISPRAFLLCF